MPINVSARDIDAMRRAHHVDVVETDGVANLSCQASRVVPIRQFVAPVTVPIAVDPDLGASPSRGGRTLAAAIRHAHRNPSWAALVNTIRDGDQLEIQWERNGYALLLVRSCGEIVDRFSFPATRRTRRVLTEQRGRPSRLLAALADIAGRVPVPSRSRTATSDAAALQPGAAPAALGDDR